jgi:hypothetical protein
LNFLFIGLSKDFVKEELQTRSEEKKELKMSEDLQKK